MDLSCIISSGDLELYVLGMLPEDEAYKIEQLSSLFPEIKEEIQRISESLEITAAASVAEPSLDVKQRIMSQLKDLKAAESTTSPTVVNTPPQESEQIPAPVIPMQRRNNALLAASLIGLAAALGIIIYLANQNTRSKTELASLQQKVDTLNTNLAQQQIQTKAYSDVVQMMQSDVFKKINLQNVPGKPKALAQVFWNTQTYEVYIADVSLPRPPQNKQYQLWAIVDGKPVDAGMLNDVKQQAQKMKTFEKADAFAITLEKKGGSITPTLEEMYVMAKTS